MKWISVRHELPKFGQIVTVKWKSERDATCITRAFCQRATWAKSGKPTGKPFWCERRGLSRIHVTHWIDDSDLFVLPVRKAQKVISRQTPEI